MLLRQVKSSTGVRILISRTAIHEHGDTARMSFLYELLGKARVITAQLLKAERGGVTCVAKQNRFQFACISFHSEVQGPDDRWDHQDLDC